MIAFAAITTIINKDLFACQINTSRKIIEASKKLRKKRDFDFSV
jgi:hypothetical protein